MNPGEVENFREAAGLFPQNTGRFVLEGELTETVRVTARPSLAGRGGIGGGLQEFLIPNAQRLVKVLRVSGVNPRF